MLSKLQRQLTAFRRWYFDMKMLAKIKLRPKVPTILILHMGKVGSSSLFKALSSHYNGAVIQSHSFSEDHHYSSIRYLFKLNQRKRQNFKIISPIREPISKNISAFFQTIHKDNNAKNALIKNDIVRLKELLLQNDKTDFPLKWFDRRILQNFDLDVYTEPFPLSGHITLSKGSYSILIYKYDLPTTLKIEIIEKFTGVTNLSIPNKNVASDKDYAKVYQDFNKKTKFSKEYLDYILNAKYTQHFFAEDLEELRHKWEE